MGEKGMPPDPAGTGGEKMSSPSLLCHVGIYNTWAGFTGTQRNLLRTREAWA